MDKNQFIKRFIAGVMLSLFAISVTPKQLFHDAITGHKHSYTKFDGVRNVHASKSNFQCNWQNDSVESPFTAQPGFQVDHPLPPYSSYFNHNICDDYSAERFFSSLRGPPSLI